MCEEVESQEKVTSFLDEMSLQVFDTRQGVSPKVQAVLALRSFNFSVKDIARLLGYADPKGVYAILRRYDPNKVTATGDSMRKIVLSSMFERIALEALLSIGENRKEIKELGVSKAMDVAAGCVKAIRALGAKSVELPKEDEAILAELKGEEA